jgi:hypothetical protein
MQRGDIHVIANNLDDWIVREEFTNREFGHYPSLSEAEAVGLMLARKRNCELVLHDAPDASTPHAASVQSWRTRLFGR